MQPVQILKKYFGYDSFREGQELLIQGILEEKMCWALCLPEPENPSATRFRH